MNGIDFSTLAKHFSSEEAARELLEGIRWPDGPICPHCGSEEAYKLTPKPDSKRPVRDGVYKCKKCRKQFTVTIGTIFEGSRIPLHKWLMAMYLMCSSKKGISAHQLHRTLGITYKSTWFMCHRIRYAMTQSPLTEKLSGIVEVDETYIGGKMKGGKRGRGSENKTPVVALVERDGKIRAKKMPRLTGKALKGFIRENVAPDAQVVTDELPSYKGLSRQFASHETVKHSKGEYVRGIASTNSVESWFALLKRGIVGTFHHVSEKHLDWYVDEFAFRFNSREVEDPERVVLALQGIERKRLEYDELARN